MTSTNPPGAGALEQSSHFVAFVLATFFLVIPIFVLLFLARRARSTPLADYGRAVLASAQPKSADVSHSLISIDGSKEITLVTWTRRASIGDYRNQPLAPAFKDTWVTIAPHVKNFCQEYVKSTGADSRQLKLRLEQRLGLPPGSDDDTFVELAIKPENTSKLFRPCIDPSPTTNSCRPAFIAACSKWSSRPENCLPRNPKELSNDLAPDDSESVQAMKNRYWFLNAYYNAYALPWQYPWTSLGYTFDWALEPGGNDFVKFGESEFILPAETPIQFASATDTVAYCTPD